VARGGAIVGTAEDAGIAGSVLSGGRKIGIGEIRGYFAP
jgi:hypothetical protein